MSLEAVPTQTPCVPSVFHEKYRIEQKLGEGGMGIVYQATHLGLCQAVAIKVLHPNALPSRDNKERLLREARTIAQLSSPHVVEVLDVAELPDGRPYIVMEYLAGEDLLSMIEREGPLPLAKAIGYVRQALAGLSEAHAKGIVHRDLKPENLRLVPGAAGEVVKLLDFGISHNQQSSALRLTQREVAIGSPHYMAPEQVEAKSDVDQRADIWSVGMVLYELVTGRLPFEGSSVPEVCGKVLMMRAAPPSQFRQSLPARFDEIVLRCLKKPREERYQSARELDAELARLEAELAAELSAGVAETVPFEPPKVELAGPERAAPAAGSEPRASDAGNLALTLGRISAVPERRQRQWLRRAALTLALALAPALGLAALHQTRPLAPSVATRGATAARSGDTARVNPSDPGVAAGLSPARSEKPVVQSQEQPQQVRELPTARTVRQAAPTPRVTQKPIVATLVPATRPNSGPRATQRGLTRKAAPVPAQIRSKDCPLRRANAERAALASAERGVAANSFELSDFGGRR